MQEGLMNAKMSTQEIILTSLLVARTEGWDPGGRILRGAPTGRFCP